MVGTFSFNEGKITEAVSYPVQDYLSLTASITIETDLLYPLMDNDEKLINPKSLRNSFFSLWTSIPFKQTFIGTHSYIGIDSLNPTDRDLKRKIFIGKRSYSGTYSYDNSHDIMNSTLLSNDVDIFLYNTKLDTISNSITRALILAGGNPLLYSDSPFIQSQRVSGLTESVSLDFVGNSGNLIIENTSSISGSFSLNGIELPTISQNYASASNNKLWFYEDGKVIWDELKLPELHDIGITGSEYNIYGTPVNINGYTLEFSDDRYTPMTIGGIKKGETFDNISISEVLRGLLYPYLNPLCSISIDNKYVEVGTYPTPVLTYTITKRSEVTKPSGLSNMIPGVYPEIINDNQVTITGTASGIVISPIGTASTLFTITVSDNSGEISSTQSASVSIEGIYPYFYGFSNKDIIDNVELFNLTKSIEYKSDKVIDISGNGNYYYIYDYNYGPLSSILDDYNNDYINSFTYSIRTLSKYPWAIKKFFVYQWNDVAQIGPPSINYQFKY
jgi:hypothetical protein